MHLLLIQVRADSDGMAAHELECVTERLGDRIERTSVRSVFSETPSPAWLDGVDAMIIGGSGAFSVHDPRSTEFVADLRHVLERALADDIPGFGICFGHQLLGMHLGATVVTDLGRRAAGTVTLELTEHGAADPVFSHLGPSFTGNTGHTDHVASVPEAVDLLAKADYTEPQAFRVRGRRFYSTQFHPDLTATGAVYRYRRFAEKLPAAEREQLERDIECFDHGRDDTKALLGTFLDSL